MFLIVGYIIILASALGTYSVHGSLAALWVPLEYIAIVGLTIGGFVAGNDIKIIKATVGASARRIEMHAELPERGGLHRDRAASSMAPAIFRATTSSVADSPTHFFPLSAICRRSSGRSIRRRMQSERAAASRSGKIIPPLLARMSTGISPEFDPTTGVPQAIASTMTRPNCSFQFVWVSEGTTSRSKELKNSGV